MGNSKGAKMRAVLAHDVVKHKWVCCFVYQVSFEDFVRRPENIKKTLTEYGRSRLSEIVDVEIDSFRIDGCMYSVTPTEDLPKIETLEESIEGVQKRLRSYLSSER